MMKKQPYFQPLLTRHGAQKALAAKTVGECALLLVLSEGLASGVELTITKVGTNVVVSWPAAATNLVLESSSSLATGWTEVTTPPVTNSQAISVTLPAVGPQQFFRLKDVISEKPSWADKDPNEKDPTADKGGECP
jgi:hypothetical protein